MPTKIIVVLSISLALLAHFIIMVVVNPRFHETRWPWLTLAAIASLVSIICATWALRRHQRQNTAICGLLLALFTLPHYCVNVPGGRVKTLRPSEKSSIKVRDLALGMLSYEREHGTFPPPAVYGKDGQALLSWRVALLPYIEEEKLYREFHLDEPWDCPHNLRLLEFMPSMYGAPQGYGTAQPFCTHYQVFVGKGAAFEGPKGVSLKDVSDGLEQTMLIVEAAVAVPWTKPEDISFTPDGPLPRVGGLFKNRFHAAFADGCEHSISKKVSDQTLRAFITRNAGDHPGNDW
jgi:hypothetical protein